MASVTRATFSTVKSAAIMALQPSVPNLIGVAKLMLFLKVGDGMFNDANAFEQLGLCNDERRRKANDIAVCWFGQQTVFFKRHTQAPSGI